MSKLIDILTALANDTMQVMTLPVEKNKKPSFKVSGFPKDAKSFLIWLIKDYVTGGTCLNNFYAWLRGSAYAVKARSLNPETKVIKENGKDKTVKNPDFKTVYPFDHAFRKFVSPDAFVKILQGKIADKQKEIDAKENTLKSLEGVLTGKALTDATATIKGEVKTLQGEIDALKADIKKAKSDS